ncbi:MAG TPA: dihydrodipicolinate synthase family protein [Candidatus Limnocylindria bacterium]|nr:dihydrodipicolinate synthase family protein [Candidatus Limnocylindria bacterium]
MRLTNFYAIAPTVFDDQGAVDTDAVVRNVAKIAAHGIDGVLLTGSYGEFQVLNADERVRLAHEVVRADSGTVVMAGAAALNGDDAIALGERLFDAGAHQVMVSAPFAAELTDGDLLAHFQRVGAALQHDLVVYNNPVFGVDLAPPLLQEVTALPAYTAIKQGTKSLAAMVDTVVRVQAGGQAQVLAAADLACAASVGAGVAGITSTNVWVFPEAFRALADPAVAPSAKTRIMAALQPYVALVRTLGQPRVVKAAMVLRGYAGSAAVRAPYVPLDRTEVKALASALAESDELLSAA